MRYQTPAGSLLIRQRCLQSDSAEIRLISEKLVIIISGFLSLQNTVVQHNIQLSYQDDDKISYLDGRPDSDEEIRLAAPYIQVSS